MSNSILSNVPTDDLLLEVAEKENRKPIAFVEIDFVNSPADLSVLTKKLKAY